MVIVNIVIKKVDKDMTGFGQGTQIGKYWALEAPRHEISIHINRIYNEILGLGQGAQIRHCGNAPSGGYAPLWRWPLREGAAKKVRHSCCCATRSVS